MKKIYLLLAIILFATISFAQDVKKDDWFRVTSDDGEFSIEVPAKYGYFYDKDGTMISDGNNSYALNEMSVFNAYTEHTLVSFEQYKASLRVLEILEEGSESSAKKQKATEGLSEIKKDGYKLKQLISKTDKHYTVRQYFYSKNYIYVLTASSREGETAAMKRFFNSLVFKPDLDRKILSGDSKFPNLKLTPIKYESKTEKPAKKEKTKPNEPNPLLSVKPTEPDSNIKPFLIISQPRASYTNTARQKNEQGAVRLKVVFSESGQITEIIAIETLQFGLLRNAVFAALRIKFLPAEKADKAYTILKTIEYRFTLY